MPELSGLDREEQIKLLEDQLINKVNVRITNEISPIYSIFYAVSAFTFGVFAFGSRYSCYAKDTQAFEASFSYTVDVSNKYRQCSLFGFILLSMMIFVYHFQRKPDYYQVFS